MTVLIAVFTLLIMYQIKHFVCDYPLQNTYMLGKFKERDWIKPLAAHCAVHALATFLIVFLFTNIWYAIALAAFDFVIHFIMDRIKASPKLLGRFEKTDPRFWYALGFDQMVHHLTHYVIIFVVVLVTFS